MPRKRQAVLLIHGIGEQRPMDTLRSFVKAVWKTDDEVKHEHAIAGIYSRPDPISENFDLRLLTTTSDREGNRTDFYEMYWAHLMKGTQLTHVAAWAKRIVLRRPGSVPRHLRLAWWLVWLLILLVVLLVLGPYLPESWRLITLPGWLAALPAGPLFALLIAPLLRNVVGDAARYLDPAPSNIGSRQRIRRHGVDVLKRLHAARAHEGTPREEALYDRIMVVGHSLGSVIGYDMLTYAWPAFNEDHDGQTPHPELDATEAMADAGLDDVGAFREQQRKLLDEGVARGLDWRVTDFLTLGSPLAHAAMLMAGDADDLQQKLVERELPACPPVLEESLFSYRKQDPIRKPHHAAVFGPTRWTNLYFPCRAVIFGDLIGGELRPVFGHGIDDRPVHTRQRANVFSHTLYWTLGRGDEALPHIQELRRALNLLDH